MDSVRLANQILRATMDVNAGLKSAAEVEAERQRASAIAVKYENATQKMAWRYFKGKPAGKVKGGPDVKVPAAGATDGDAVGSRLLGNPAPRDTASYVNWQDTNPSGRDAGRAGWDQTILQRMARRYSGG